MGRYWTKLVSSIQKEVSVIRVKLRKAMDEHRQRTGERMTYERLAQATGLSPRTLESLASRPGYNTTLDTIARLCRAFECQPGDLLVLDAERRDEH